MHSPFFAGIRLPVCRRQLRSPGLMTGWSALADCRVDWPAMVCSWLPAGTLRAMTAALTPRVAIKLATRMVGLDMGRPRQSLWGGGSMLHPSRTAGNRRVSTISPGLRYACVFETPARMRAIRLHAELPLAVGTELPLPPQAGEHAIRVLRLAE